MKYFLVGGFGLLVLVLVSKVFVVLGLINLETFSSEARIKQTKVEQINEKKLQTIGKQTYEVFCSSCHGMDGKGNNGKAHNHTKRIAKKTVLDIIKNGSNNFKTIYPSGMPSGLVNEMEAQEVATYVANGMKTKKPKAWSVCASCHDESGEGILYVAPNIKYYSDELVLTVLKNGKKGVIGTMPDSFADKLSEIQIKALANYIRSIQK
ncbi:c-type cytochrome [Sulfurimonas sp.]|uniref:c-type cytochrome n=1 Tax=Sulfurimonas sp. TaxID=2022749 RepID=UPI003564BDD7